MTLIGPGTWEAARAAVDTALTAAALVLEGEPAAYACCRPPGHHATRSSFGGSCYLNNAAAAAARLRAAGHRVAVLDIDAHHGNGTQAIFYEDPEVLVGSVHVDPAAGWFPHFLGFASETGGGANRNLPIAPGSGDEPWLAAVRDLAEWARTGDAAALVVALGVDAAGGDPESPLEVSAAGFREAGRALGALGLPTVLVQEGGYDLDTLGELVREVLTGVEEGLSILPGGIGTLVGWQPPRQRRAATPRRRTNCSTGCAGSRGRSAASSAWSRTTATASTSSPRSRPSRRRSTRSPSASSTITPPTA